MRGIDGTSGAAANISVSLVSLVRESPRDRFGHEAVVPVPALPSTFEGGSFAA
jgi:hypothetical protein